ncbi:hypothetical protein D3C80_2171440 [compost metagenome]
MQITGVAIVKDQHDHLPMAWRLVRALVATGTAALVFQRVEQDLDRLQVAQLVQMPAAAVIQVMQILFQQLP